MGNWDGPDRIPTVLVSAGALLVVTLILLPGPLARHGRGTYLRALVRRRPETVAALRDLRAWHGLQSVASVPFATAGWSDVERLLDRPRGPSEPEPGATS